MEVLPVGEAEILSVFLFTMMSGGSSMNASYWANSLANGSHNKEEGFAHAYCGSDGIQQVEDDANCAWHCGNTNGNTNYLSIEVCQSMGDLKLHLKQMRNVALTVVRSKV